MTSRTPDAPSGDAILPSETNHVFLRRVTRVWHERVDAAYASHDLASRAGLAGFLLRQARAVATVEDRIEACRASSLLPDWNIRSRRSAIAADLAQLGLAMPAPVEIEAFRSPLLGFGALYVLEGSKLGGRVLLRTAMASPDAGVRAATRFLGHPNAGGWARFLAILNGIPQTADNIQALKDGALAAFAAFVSVAAAALPEAASLPHEQLGGGDDVASPALSIPVKHETARTHGEHAA